MNIAMHTSTPEFADLLWRDAPLRLEYQWVGVRQSAYPVVVFLHEGLGSLAMWKDFPEKLCSQNGLTGLVFSRYGYGQSTTRALAETWPITFMHAQAYEVLPALFATLGIERPWLFGHSDGGSIALLYAARFADAVSGIIVAAPHIFVEDLTIASIADVRATYVSTDLREKLGRYHADPDSAFWGWNDVWLNPAFRSWNIEAKLATITCPVLAIQGEEDEYGSLDQIYGIRRNVHQTKLLVLPHCGHSPHRDQPAAVMREVAQLIVGSACTL
ncbi:MAG: alpha/beta hydrolase [Herminiimonas sp.]|nr:alpha/beta hydrolase [Herminiimonas sp.]